jgi:hypothetical protein
MPFNCDHGDLLYIVPDGPEEKFHAIYFDNEGHVIKYTVSTTSPTTAISFPMIQNLVRSFVSRMSGRVTRCSANFRRAPQAKLNGNRILSGAVTSYRSFPVLSGERLAPQYLKGSFPVKHSA